MKIALCFSGHSRTHLDTYSGWYQHLLSQYDVDVFFHLWDTTGFRNFYSDTTDSGVLPGDYVTRNQFDVWRPRDVAIDNYTVLEPYFQTIVDKWYTERARLGLRDIDRPVANAAMYYKWYVCNEMKRRAEEERGIKYDIVIRTRPDVDLLSPLPINIFVDTTKVWIPKVGSWATDEVSDYITIGTSEQIDTWCNIFLELDEKYKRALSEGDFTRCLYPHKLFYYHFIYHNLPFGEVDIACEIRR